MTRIMLCCSAGMSTSMLVTKMRTAAETRNLETFIEAYGASEFDERVKDFDVILLGPQVRYMKKDFAERAKPYGVPVESINPMDYGTMNGDKVLKFALDLIS